MINKIPTHHVNCTTTGRQKNAVVEWSRGGNQIAKFLLTNSAIQVDGMVKPQQDKLLKYATLVESSATLHAVQQTFFLIFLGI